MRKALLFTAILVSVLLAVSEARAQCTCVAERVNITAEKEFDLAYSVFVGKVVAVNKTPRDKNDHYVETVTFAVENAWKHDLQSNILIANEIQGCVNGFDENEEWLVYAYRNADGTLGTYCCCSRTSPVARAADDLKFLDQQAPAKVLRERALNTDGPNKSLDARLDSLFLN